MLLNQSCEGGSMVQTHYNEEVSRAKMSTKVESYQGGKERANNATVTRRARHQSGKSQ